MVVAALGLALFGCGDDTTTETTMGGSASATMTSSPGDTGSSTNPSTLSESGATTSASDDTTSFGGADYAGPGTFFTSTDGETTTGGTDTDTDTDTNTGATGSGGGLTDSGGQDYAGAGVSPKR